MHPGNTGKANRMIDVKRAKTETPGVNHVTHFNNAGAAIIPQPVRQARCRTEMVRASVRYCNT
jgi:hypothetical protein